MGYIKFKIKTQRFGENNSRTSATIANLESDMNDTSIFELPIIMRALSRGTKPQNSLPLTLPFALGAK